MVLASLWAKSRSRANGSRGPRALDTVTRSVGRWEPRGFGVWEWNGQSRTLGRLIWPLFLCDDPTEGLQVTACGRHSETRPRLSELCFEPKLSGTAPRVCGSLAPLPGLLSPGHRPSLLCTPRGHSRLKPVRSFGAGRWWGADPDPRSPVDHRGPVPLA